MQIRAITDDEVPAFRACALETFGVDADDDTNGPTRQRAMIPLDRAWIAVDAGQVVATAASFPLEMHVAGGTTLRTAGLTMVTVRPTHRRRGLLRELIRVHLDDMRARGEPLSALWASEAAIYGRFGYGVSAEALALEVDTRGLAIGGGGDDIACRYAQRDEVMSACTGVYARAIRERPGAMVRGEVWWRERAFLEGPLWTAGASKQRYVIARRGSEAVGYVMFRQREGGSGNRVEVSELLACDAGAEAALWRFLAGVDLFPTVAWKNAPADASIAWLASDPRKVTRKLVDTLWVRVDDVPAVLAARRYANDGRLRIGLDGATWELVVERGEGRCARVDAAPDLELDRAALGSLLLGGVTARMLASAGRLRGNVSDADRLFAWHIAPWCPEQF